MNKNELGVHLNGDEAMCFGSAFIASNSSASFKVRKVYLTQHPDFEIHIDISPLDESKTQSAKTSSDEGEEEEVEETTPISYNRNYVVYKKNDFLGQKKTISFKYDTDMKVDVYQVKGENEN